MYKVLLVDDERLLRLTLKNILDWNALQCEVIAAAKDGSEALAVVEKARPDLIITDLRMPKMDGIEMIRRVKEVSPAAQIIVLSNYSEFELVRDAMKAGAFDYLLKVTLEKEELERVVRQALSHCEQAQEQETHEEESWLKEIRQRLLLLKNEQTMPQSGTYPFSLSHGASYREGYLLVYLHVDNSSLLYGQKYQNHERLERYLSDQIKDSFPLELCYECIFLNHHSAMLLIQGKQRQQTANLCYHLLRNIRQYLNIQLSLILSDVQSDPFVFYEVCAKLMHASRQHFYRGTDCLLFLEEKEQYASLDVSQTQLPMELLEAMKNRDFHQVSSLLSASLSYMEKQRIEPYQVIEYFVFLLHNIEGNEIVRGHKTMCSLDAIVTRLRQCETFDKLKELLFEGFAQLEKWIKDIATDRYRKEIMDIMDFIEEHYCQKLTLKTIADRFSMSESSLSHLFKNETGVNLKAYINEKRMKKAMELLSDNSYRIKDVASRIGIEDQLYFNRVFKKYCRLSPSDYRKKLQKGEENTCSDRII